MCEYLPNPRHFVLLSCISMSFLLVNRLVLNLRRAGNADNTSAVSSLAMPSFAEPEHSILGNIGAHLRDGTEDYEDEDERDEQDPVSHSTQPGEA